jgi:hypothetical protein
VTGIQGRYVILPLLVFSCSLSGNAAVLQSRRGYIAYPILATTGIVGLYVMTSALLQKYYVSPAVWVQ